MMPGDDQLRGRAQRRAAIRHHLGGFDLDIDGARSILNREIENTQLLLDAAVEFAVVLMAAAGGEDGAVRIAFQKLRDGLGALNRIAQIVETEFEEVLAGLGFAAGLFEETRNVRQTERNADSGKRTPCVGHIGFEKQKPGAPAVQVLKAYQVLNRNDIERRENFEIEPGVRHAQEFSTPGRGHSQR